MAGADTLFQQNPDLLPGTDDPNDPSVGVPVDKTKRQLSPQSTGNIPPPPTFSMPPAPKLYDAPYPGQFGLAPQQQEPSPFEVFKNPMVVLAGLSSLFTRQPLMGAMNFATGAMNGYRQGNNEIFQQNKSKFDEAMKATIEQNKTELDKYTVAWDRKKGEAFAKSIPALWTEAVKNNDQVMMAALQSNNPDIVWKLLESRQTAQLHMQNAVDLADAREQAREAEVNRLKSDPGVVAQAKAIREYDQPMPPLSRNNPRNQAINELVTEQSATAGEDYETPNYAAKNKFVTGLGSLTPGSPGGQVTSANTIVGHLNTLDRLTNDLNSGSNTVAFRRAAQALQIEFGLSSAPTNFDVAREMIGGEIVKLVVGAGGTGEDREKTRSAFDRANSPKLLHDAINVTREIIGSRVGSLVNTAKGLHADKQLMRILKPETIKALQAEGGEKPTPTQKDRDYVRAHPETRNDFIAHFGVEP